MPIQCSSTSKPVIEAERITSPRSSTNGAASLQKNKRRTSSSSATTASLALLFRGCMHSIRLDDLLPHVDLTGIDACFTEVEIWATIKELPSDRAPGPDGFTAAFYKAAWEIIKPDILNAFNTLWSLDARSFYLLNDALMILLRKNAQLLRRKTTCQSASCIASAKSLPNAWLVGLLPKELVAQNQSAFVKGRSIHDNFRSVQLTSRRLSIRSLGLTCWRSWSTSVFLGGGGTGSLFFCHQPAQRCCSMGGRGEELHMLVV